MASFDEIPPEVCVYIYIYSPTYCFDTTMPYFKNYRGITLTSIADKIYNAVLLNRIEPKIEKILRTNQNGFRRNRFATSQILKIRRNLEGNHAKNTEATLLFVDFSKTYTEGRWSKYFRETPLPL